MGLLSIWFNNPARLATALGLFSAGMAFALQQVVTAVAGYFTILRGRTFNVGDRITMGGVRGDVIAIGFLQTTIMEMGQPPEVARADPAMWVMARQYSGRMVTVSNSKIFSEPVYNYTRDFPYIWEEMHLPIPYNADRNRAEKILLQVAQRHSLNISELAEDVLKELERRYFVRRTELHPQVYFRLTDNWIQLSVRFLCLDYGIRRVKDGMSRDILSQLETAGITIASSTYDVVGMPPLKVQLEPTMFRDDANSSHGRPGGDSSSRS
jgi:small-conductance mechanosensitive channel